MRRVPSILLATAMLLGSSATAVAHELQVLSPGTAELDLGRLSRELLVHATLQDGDDELRITLQAPPATETWLLEVLVPDAEPERSAKPGALPSVEVDGRTTDATADIGADLEVRDEVTGVRYWVAAGEERDLAFEPGRNVVTVGCVDSGARCGDVPTRIALRVFSADGTGFAAQDVDRTRISVARVVEWASSGAQDRSERAGSSGSSRRLVAWFGGAISSIAVLTALWWVVRGRRSSRTRGAERAAEERVDSPMRLPH